MMIELLKYRPGMPIHAGMRVLVFRKIADFCCEWSPALIVSINSDGDPEFLFDGDEPREGQLQKLSMDVRQENGDVINYIHSYPHLLHGKRFLMWDRDRQGWEPGTIIFGNGVNGGGYSIRFDHPVVPVRVKAELTPAQERSRNRWAGYQVVLGLIFLFIYLGTVGNAKGVPGGLFLLGLVFIIGFFSLLTYLAYRFPTATKAVAVIGGGVAAASMASRVYRAAAHPSTGDSSTWLPPAPVPPAVPPAPSGRYIYHEMNTPYAHGSNGQTYVGNGGPLQWVRDPQ